MGLSLSLTPPSDPQPGRRGAHPSVVAEAGHGEGTGEGLDALAKVTQASLSLWVLQQEGLEVLELTWGWGQQVRREEPHGSSIPSQVPAAGVGSPFVAPQEEKG